MNRISATNIIKAAQIVADLPALVLHQRPPSGPTVRVAAVGDVGLSGGVRHSAETGTYTERFAAIAPLLRHADLTLGNLETPVAPSGARQTLFAASSEGVASLKEAGFDLLHLANNHVYDFGPDGIEATLDAVEANGMTPLGVAYLSGDPAQPARCEIDGVRLGWLGCGKSMNPPSGTRRFFWEMDGDQLRDAARALRPAVDTLIVSIHAGVFLSEYPDPDHRALVQALLSDGADIVLLHNPHVLQGVESVSGGVACYSLGNLLFDWREGHVEAGMLVREQREGGVFLFDCDADGVAQAVFLPTVVDDAYRVTWATGPVGDAIVTRLERLSAELHTDYRAKFEQQRAERNSGLLLRAGAHHLRQRNWRELSIMARRVRPHHMAMLARWASQRVARKA